MRSRTFVVSVVLVLTAGATVARSDPIRACVNRRSGEIKLLVSGACPPGEALLEWNTEAPAPPRRRTPAPRR